MNDKLAVETKNLSKNFGKIKALDGINLEINMGTVMALLGPNGAGKTTFVRILATLMKPDDGWAKEVAMGARLLAGPTRILFQTQSEILAVPPTQIGLTCVQEVPVQPSAGP
jgi:ABC-type branched-subunit amino acid transport system ATPase component